PFDRCAEYLVDGSGFFNGMHHTNPDQHMWLNQGTFGNVPEEEFDLNPEIVFDLGEEQPVDYVKVWNYNEFLPNRPELAGRGVHLMDVYIAGEDEVFMLLAGDVELDLAPQLADVDFGQIVPLGGANARYIKFDNLRNFPADGGFPGGDNNFVGLSEVQFYAVPEPATGLLLVLGGLTVLIARRRRR
ncbi:MAG: PEP-CTERM sorting domain-containing protein, partial [Candidatus Nealsonbacteria bacterium]|nr:PEP-CTERM sorting domain-containing protein [Candidatus Nealsonbacteria bacterium]